MLAPNLDHDSPSLNDHGTLPVTALIRSWFWLHLISLGFIIVQKSTPAVLLGRYSRNSAIILAFFLLSAPLAWIVPRWLARQSTRWQLTRRQSALLVLVCTAGLLGIWLFHIGPTLSYGIIRLYLTAVLLTVALWALQQHDLPRATSGLAALAFTGVIVFLVSIAPGYPDMFWVDEGFMANTAWQSAETGVQLATMYQPVHRETYSFSHVWLGQWFKLFGVSIASARLYGLALSIAGLSILALAARRLYHTFAVLTGVSLGLFALSSINYLYKDIETLLLLSLALSLYILAITTGKPWLHLLTGLAAALSLDGHPAAYVYCLAFGAAYLLECALQSWQARHLTGWQPVAYLLAGGLIGLGLYTGYYMQTNTTFANQATGEQSDLGLFGVSAALHTLWEQYDMGLHDIPLLFGLGLMSVPVALLRRSKIDRLLVVVLFVSQIILAVTYARYRFYYLMHILPFLVLLTAGAAEAIAAAVAPHRRPTLAAALCLLLIATGLSLTWDTKSNDHGYGGILTVGKQARAYIPQDAAVIGIEPLYFSFWDYPEFKDITVGFQAGRDRDQSELESWYTLNPAAVLLVRGLPLQQHVAVLDQYITESERYTPVAC